MKRILLTIIGFLCLGLGTLGVIVPVLPTTPFVLLAALCFSYSSKKFHNWLRKNRIFGQYIENYYTKQGISISLKVASITFLWIGLIVSMVIVRTVWIYVLLGIIGIGVTTHLLFIKTKKKPQKYDFTTDAMESVAPEVQRG